MGILTVTTIKPDGTFTTDTIDTSKEKESYVSKSKGKKDRKQVSELDKEATSD